MTTTQFIELDAHEILHALTKAAFQKFGLREGTPVKGTIANLTMVAGKPRHATLKLELGLAPNEESEPIPVEVVELAQTLGWAAWDLLKAVPYGLMTDEMRDALMPKSTDPSPGLAVTIQEAHDSITAAMSHPTTHPTFGAVRSDSSVMVGFTRNRQGEPVPVYSTQPVPDDLRHPNPYDTHYVPLVQPETQTIVPEGVGEPVFTGTPATPRRRPETFLPPKVAFYADLAGNEADVLVHQITSDGMAYVEWPSGQRNATPLDLLKDQAGKPL